MRDLHKKALIRAYRTFAQGLAGSALVTTVVGILNGTDTVRTVLTGVATIVVTAFLSFWQGVAKGLPESDD